MPRISNTSYTTTLSCWSRSHLSQRKLLYSFLYCPCHHLNVLMLNWHLTFFSGKQSLSWSLHHFRPGILSATWSIWPVIYCACTDFYRCLIFILCSALSMLPGLRDLRYGQNVECGACEDPTWLYNITTIISPESGYQVLYVNLWCCNSIPHSLVPAFKASVMCSWSCTPGKCRVSKFLWCISLTWHNGKWSVFTAIAGSPHVACECPIMLKCNNPGHFLSHSCIHSIHLSSYCSPTRDSVLWLHLMHQIQDIHTIHSCN